MKENILPHKIAGHTGGQVRFITGEDLGYPAWWYVEINRLKQSLYEKVIGKDDSLDLKQFGKVLKSGWGALPPEDIQQEMEQLFHVKISA